MIPEDDGGRDIGWTDRTLLTFGYLVRPLFAEACSTAEVPITVDMIDWIPQPYPEGAIVSAPCSIEIETFGFPERVFSLTEERLLELKRAIIEITDTALFVQNPADRRLFKIPHDKPLLWIKYQDVRGHHV